MMVMSGIPSPLVLDPAEVVFTHFLILCPYFLLFKMSSPLNSVYLHPLPAYWLKLSPSYFVTEWFCRFVGSLPCPMFRHLSWNKSSSTLLTAGQVLPQPSQALDTKNYIPKAHIDTAIWGLQSFSSNSTPPYIFIEQ